MATKTIHNFVTGGKADIPGAVAYVTECTLLPDSDRDRWPKVKHARNVLRRTISAAAGMSGRTGGITEQERRALCREHGLTVLKAAKCF